VRGQGYDRVGSTLPAIRQPGGVPERYAFVDRVRLAMTRAGLREVRPMPFLSDKELRLFGGGDAVRITNPLQANDGLLRTQLLPGLLRVARRNAYRQVRQVAIFEVSQRFRLVSGAVDERRSVAFVMTGSANESWHTARREFDVFDAKGVIEELLAAVGVAWTASERAGAPFHPGRSAYVVAESKTVGVFGELHPSIAAAFDLTGRVAVGELDVDAIADRATDMPQVSDVPRFPPVRRDLAFVVDASTKAGRLHAALEEAGGDLIDSVVLFDVHAGPPLPDGKKSLAFSVDLRASDRTLTDAAANDVVAVIAERLARDFGAELRSS
jgi:phenylalanyl-tRNA synthetase beta chain